MQEKLKNYLYLSIIVGIIYSIVAITWYLNLYSERTTPLASFSVSAEGKVIAVPDVAEIRLTVISEGKDLVIIQKENSEKVNKVINFIKEKGIKSEDIKTEAYNLQPKYDWQKSPYQIVGYTLSQTILVKVRDLNKIGEILSEAVKNGVNQISGPNFIIDDPEKLKSQAREIAIKKAKEKAEGVAKLSGFKLVRITSYEEVEEGFNYPIYPLRAPEVKTNENIVPQIEPGSQEIKVKVILTYEIK
jgi:hypothetical protein